MRDAQTYSVILTAISLVGGLIWTTFMTIIMLRVRNTVQGVESRLELKSNNAISELVRSGALSSAEIKEIRRDIGEIKERYLDSNLAEAKLEPMRANLLQFRTKLSEIELDNSKKRHSMANKVTAILLQVGDINLRLKVVEDKVTSLLGE